MPEVSCKAVAAKNSSEWPCSMCPIPQLRLVGVRTTYIYIYIFLLFPAHQVLDPITNPYFGPPLGCTLLHKDRKEASNGGFSNSDTYNVRMNILSTLSSTVTWKIENTLSKLCRFG